MGPIPKLTIGRGFKQRLTKAGLKADAHFDQIVNAYLATVGTKPGYLVYEWAVETTYGTLGVSSHGHWIACCFADWPRAKAAGFRHWKWNHHWDVGAAEAELEQFKRQLEPLLKGKEQDHDER